MQPNGMLESKGPEFGCDNFGPSRHCMQEHGLCMGFDNTNLAFNHANLPVGANATKGMLLAVNI